jgi:peptidoglycan/LPS O-acetylase OafA/YrhL
LFFQSGFLITTLLRSEFDRSGRIDLGGLYLRAALRIFPRGTACSSLPRRSRRSACSRARSVLSWRPVAFLGVISYSFSSVAAGTPSEAVAGT